MTEHRPSVRFDTIRPLIRYVDEDQAVIETYFSLTSPLPNLMDDGPPRQAIVLLQLRGMDGFHDEQAAAVPLSEGKGAAKLHIVSPTRWWPAGMGEQPLYELTVSLVLDQQITDTRTITLGLTSVRCPRSEPQTLLVNGQQRTIRSVVPVDLSDEHHLLPVSSDSILMIRGHYGPDVLYEAADRAGILMIQCVPIDPQGRPETLIDEQVQRLAMHPSLVGWFIGHLGQMSHTVATRLKSLDPTHNIFHALTNLPDGHAA